MNKLWNFLLLFKVVVEAAAAAVAAVVAVDEKAIGHVEAAATQTSLGEMNATDAKSPKVKVCTNSIE